MNDEERQQANKRILKKTLIIVVAMLGFAYALIPLTNLVINATGITGKTGRLDKEKLQTVKPDMSRTITVLFDGTLNAGMPWDFRPMQLKMEVHPGEVANMAFYAKNLSNHDMVGKAVESITPTRAGKYFSKSKCFCFDEQKLAPQEGKELPVRYVIDPSIPDNVKTITLSYTLFDVTKNVKTTRN